MATSEATIIDAGGRELRVSSPDRVIFPRDRAHARHHQARHRRVLPRGRRRHHARAARTGRRRSSAGRRACTRASSLSTREKGGGDAFFQKRIPRGAPDYVETARIHVPLRPPRRRDLPDGDRRRRLGGADGHDHLPPVAGAPRRRRPSRRAAHRPRPAAGHGLRRRRARRGRGRARCSTTSATSASRRPRAGAASTSTSASSRAGRSPTCATPRSRSAASSSGACRAR